MVDDGAGAMDGAYADDGEGAMDGAMTENGDEGAL